VSLARSISTADGSLPPSATGTVVHVYPEESAYEIEFFKPFHTVATVEAAAIREWAEPHCPMSRARSWPMRRCATICWTLRIRITEATPGSSGGSASRNSTGRICRTPCGFTLMPIRWRSSRGTPTASATRSDAPCRHRMGGTPASPQSGSQIHPATGRRCHRVSVAFQPPLPVDRPPLSPGIRIEACPPGDSNPHANWLRILSLVFCFPQAPVRLRALPETVGCSGIYQKGPP
jgi:hypothetical protein